MKKKLTIITVLLLAIVIMGIVYIEYYGIPEKIRRLQCELDGNQWRPAVGLFGPSCITLYSDGNTSCVSSTECQGSCVVKNGASKEEALCQSSSDAYLSCFYVTIEEYNNGTVINTACATI